MDQIYAPIDDRWVTNSFSCKEFLAGFRLKLEETCQCPSTTEETLAKLLNRPLREGEFEELSRTCDVQKFNCVAEPSIKLPPNAPGDSCVSFPITEEGKSYLSTLRVLSSSQQRYGEESSRAIVLPNTNKKSTCLKLETSPTGDANLKPMQHVLLTVRIYHPFQQLYGARKKNSPVLAQIVNVLAEQPLVNLKDLIFCVNDYAVPGDRSENLDDEITTSNKEIYPSGFFFIEGIFYNDLRGPNCKDYSEVILKWMDGLPNKPKNVTASSMESVKFEDLSFRLGYPYVYIHQGSCEHLIIFSDARLINSSDSLVSTEYPLLVYLYKKYSIHCNFCGLYVAIWILYACDRVPYRLVHLCNRCLRMYCYKNQKKIGSFYLYEYIDPSSITPEACFD